MTMLTTCRRCGREWQPDRADDVRGLWRTCPRCRGDPDGALTRTTGDVTEHDRAGQPATDDQEHGA